MSEAEPETDLQDCEECVAPAEAFGTVASETRLAILEALWRADDRPVRFSDLRREVGMRDSAQFNYHLDKLRDQFVVKREDGYDLRHAGESVVRAVLAGEFNERPDVDPFEVPGDCVDCGGSLWAHYHDEKLSIECADCSTLHGRYAFPPGGLADRTDREVARAFDQRVRHLHCLAADGVCPECNGPMDTHIRDDDGPLNLSVRVEHVCGRCDHRLHSSVGLSLLDDADVVAAHSAHDVDLTGRPYWTLPWCVSDEYATVVSEDPWRIDVDIPLTEVDPVEGYGPADRDEAGSVGASAGAGPGSTPGTVCEVARPPAALTVTLDGDLTVVDVEAARPD